MDDRKTIDSNKGGGETGHREKGNCETDNAVKPGALSIERWFGLM